MSLYTRFTDQPNEVTCTDECAANWPPLLTSETTQGISGNFDVIERPDGTFQWTLLGYPLYRYVNDAVSGDVSGDGVGGQWALARPIPVTSGDIGGDEALVASGTTAGMTPESERIDKDGFTLYFFEQDADGVSTCTLDCPSNWPPLLADTGAVADGDRYSLIMRDDNTMQWAYDGRALYYFANDTAAGESNGSSVANWLVARP